MSMEIHYYKVQYNKEESIFPPVRTLYIFNYVIICFIFLTHWAGYLFSKNRQGWDNNLIWNTKKSMRWNSQIVIPLK